MKKGEPVPIDFVRKCRELRKVAAVMAHYGIGKTVFERWRDESGYRFRAVLPPPPHLERSVKNRTVLQIAEYHGVSPKVVRRWLKVKGLKTLRPVAKEKVLKGPARIFRPIPIDFAKKAAQLTTAGLIEHYKSSRSVVRRWFAESGVTPKAIDRSLVSRIARRNSVTPKYIGVTYLRNRSMQDEAADTLRRFCPVHRCDENGKYSANGEFWRVGVAIVTPDELLQRAAKYERKVA